MNINGGIGMITSEISQILNVFNNNYIYEIPDFQRDFVWGRVEIDRLFQDFSEDTEGFTAEVKNLDGYLLGNIVLINNSTQDTHKIVIDGQQRLTTLSLLYKALENLLKEKMVTSGGQELIWAQMSSDLSKGYGLFDDYNNFESPKILHHDSLKFGSSYRKIIRDQLTESDDLETSADSQINEVFESINDQLRALDDNQLKKLIQYVKNKVLLIVTTAPNISKAFQLFEILNNRGKDLEPLDLIKNNLLKNIDEQDLNGPIRQKFNEDWSAFIENLEISKKKKIESSTFLKHFLMGTRGENVRKENLYKYFSNEEDTLYSDTESIMKLVGDFKRVSKIYGSIEEKDYADFLDEDLHMYILFQLLKMKQMHVMLIPFYYASREAKKDVVDLAIRFGASVVFSFTPANFIEKELPNKIKKFKTMEMDQGFDPAFKVFKADIESLIKERSVLVKEAVSSRKFENTRGNYTVKGLDLLKFIELYAHENRHVITSVAARQLSLEHILPRNMELYEPKLAGFKDEAEMRDYRNRIGNLALIKSSDNSHLGKKVFSDKRDVYAKSDFYSTRVIGGELTTHIIGGRDRVLVEQVNDNLSTITESDYWSKAMILDRSKKIGEYMELILTKDI